MKPSDRIWSFIIIISTILFMRYDYDLFVICFIINMIVSSVAYIRAVVGNVKSEDYMCDVFEEDVEDYILKLWCMTSPLHWISKFNKYINGKF